MTNDNYTEITKLKKYVKFSEATTGQVLVEDAIFTGTEMNQFDRMNFLFEKEGEVLALPECGALKHNNSLGKMKVGYLFKIVYDGEGLIEKGAMKGKNFHKLKIFSKPGDGTFAPIDSDDNNVPF